MSEYAHLFLPAVPSSPILERLARAGGDEVGSGNLGNPESSAALAVNTIGWFIERPELFPAFPSMPDFDWPAVAVDVEYCARFPWRGGRHPWLDGAVETPQWLIGIESKRFEPFRDAKSVSFSKAYDRPVWGEGMAPYEQMRDRLRSRAERFTFLDAAQLVKHAFGLVTDGRRKGKRPALIYLFAEPPHRGGIDIPASDIAAHRSEIARFTQAVAGSEVFFSAISYREWLSNWTEGSLQEHRRAIEERFAP